MSKHSNKILGFTILEVLFAMLVLAVTTFTVLGLLKLSDEMSYMAKADSKISQIIKARGSILVKGSFQRLVGAALTPGVPAFAGDVYKFQNGRFTSSHTPQTQYHNNLHPIFPFLESSYQFDISPSPGDVNHMLSGKPMPGDTNFRDIFPFIEYVELDFNAAPAQANQVKITYRLYWVNEFKRVTDSNRLGIVELIFYKYDTLDF